jgi:3-methyladenine DNA glycosylase AlkD
MHNQMSITGLKKELLRLANPEQAKVLSGFFKTGPGQYGAGDIFLGIKVPVQRKLARQNRDMDLKDVKRLLHSEIHEERLISLMILIDKYDRGTDNEREKIIELYLANTAHINNWDLVDLSAHKLLGRHLYRKNVDLLFSLAQSPSLWERRIAITATYYFIKKGHIETTLKIAKLLLSDKHDLIHKAVGWMLREAGKKDVSSEMRFIDKYAAVMPRTMLRYAIEKFPEDLRRKYMDKRLQSKHQTN